jgi:uncharacterized protein (DUF924 family)
VRARECKQRNVETPESILEYWLGSNADDATVAAERSNLWWSRNAAVDDEIRQRFEPLVLKAASGELTAWASKPKGLLPLILLTDQFPRNIYRDSARAFAFDAKALVWCRDGIKSDFDLKLRPIERVFFYLPLEHAEALEYQEQAVKLFRQLAESVTGDHGTLFEEYLDFAVRHRDIIARFGRFPHRNKILGRESTAEELEFLSERGSSF